MSIIRRLLPLFLALTACDCDERLKGIDSEQLPVDEATSTGVAATAALEISPQSLNYVRLCTPSQDNVALYNAGNAPLEVRALRLDGTGWSIANPPALPTSIAPGKTLYVRLVGTDGTATLVVESSDLSRPTQSIPLVARTNRPPRVTMVTPRTDEIVPEGADVVLEALVEDDDGADDTVTVDFLTGSGVIASDIAPVDGRARFVWVAQGRPVGKQTVTAEAHDACDAADVADLPICLDAIDRYESIGLGDWKLYGGSIIDANGDLQMTDATSQKVGTAFDISKKVSAKKVDISFAFRIGNEPAQGGADGFALVLLDPSRKSEPFIGASGEGLGYGCGPGGGCNPLPGWALELDYFRNLFDPTPTPHVAFSVDGLMAMSSSLSADGSTKLFADLPESLGLWTSLGTNGQGVVMDSDWHEMQIQFELPHMKVTIDDITVLEFDLPMPFIYDGKTYDFSHEAYVGFSAATGGSTNYHRIRSLSVNKHLCEATNRG